MVFEQCCTGTISYDVKYTDVTDCSTDTITGINFSYAQLSNLIGGHTYEWSVQTHNGSEVSGFSAPDSFMVDASQSAAPTPIALWPVNHPPVISKAPFLSWYLSSVPASTPTYHLYVSTVLGDYSSALEFTTTSTTFTIPDSSELTAGQTYYWYVTSTVNSVTSSPSSEESFTVDAGLSGVSTPVASWPDGGTTMYSLTPSFSWYLSGLASGSITYNLEIKPIGTPFDGTTGILTGKNFHILQFNKFAYRRYSISLESSVSEFNFRNLSLV